MKQFISKYWSLVILLPSVIAFLAIRGCWIKHNENIALTESEEAWAYHIRYKKGVGHQGMIFYYFNQKGDRISVSTPILLGHKLKRGDSLRIRYSTIDNSVVEIIDDRIK